jgi:nitrogen regulatory protein PII
MPTLLPPKTGQIGDGLGEVCDDLEFKAVRIRTGETDVDAL